MLFNSISFGLFFPIIFFLYWFVFSKKLTLQNTLLFVASYFFYACWDWRFMFLLLFSTLLDFFTGFKIEQNSDKKKLWLWISIAINLGFLATFKYYNFFVGSFDDLLSACGLNINTSTLNIILPVGISFYTFHGLSYVIDIYNGKIHAEKHFINYAVFVSFFPLLVAGPIERATHLLPQVKKDRKFNYNLAASGMRLILWGLFKKLMIADRLAVFVDSTYGNIPEAEGFPLIIGTLFFALQLYLDFSAYSDIAVGVGKLLGFDLYINFKRPYFSTSFGNFWKRWHISLSSWFQDYVYIPLGGSKISKSNTIRNILIVFALSGLWHGASWNFIIWGLINALFLILLDPILNKIRSKVTFIQLCKGLFITLCWAASLVFFRAETLKEAISIFVHTGFENSNKVLNFGLNAAELKLVLWLVILLFVAEFVIEKNEEIILKLWKKLPSIIRLSFYLLIVLTIIYYGQYGNGNENSFIYFQF
jgi:D-alanyl-lipoteichoic acid acyltransferase DltB (MBOAT superfamily)